MSVWEKCRQDVTEKLQDVGFKKRAGEIYTYEPAKGFLGWLGLNQAKRDASVEINPVVGIRSQEIEKRLAELLGDKPHAYLPPTVSISLGYLMPEKKYKAWLFEKESDAATVADLVQAVQSYAIHFINSSANLEAIRVLLEFPAYAHAEHSACRVPLAYALLGSKSAAKESCMSYLLGLKDRNDLAATQYRHFAEALSEWLR